MNTTDYLAEIIKELEQTTPLIAENDAKQLVDTLLKSNKIFVAGAGRSGFAGKAFVMRMMHMGIDAYVVGETVTANLEQDNLLIIGSGSGETRTLIPIAKKAQELGGKVVVVTINPESTLGQLADLTVKLPGKTKDGSNGDYQTIQPMGSLFEQTLLLFYDAIILRFMEIKNLDSNKMYGKHANLE